MGDRVTSDIRRFAEEAAADARTATENLASRYLRAVEDFTEVAAANGRLQATLEQERVDASTVADDLAQANAVVHRYQGLIISLARMMEDHPEVELTDWQASQVKIVREESMQASRAVIAGRLPRLRTLMEEKADGPPETLDRFATVRPHVPLGVCPGCDEIVYSGQTFNMHKVSWGADFAGDRPGSMLVFTHREHGGGDHSRDGE